MQKYIRTAMNSNTATVTAAAAGLTTHLATLKLGPPMATSLKSQLSTSLKSQLSSRLVFDIIVSATCLYVCVHCVIQ
jgi:hypothetical protein